MDVLKPPIVTIGGRCYRRHPAQINSSSNSGARYEDEEEDRFDERDVEMYEEEDMYSQERQDDESCDLSCDPLEMERTRDGYCLVMEVPAKFYGFIIGQRGETKKRIEQETRTIVQIPKVHAKIEEITITGKTRQDVASAKTRIDILVATIRQKTPFTHFVALPLNSKPIMDRFLEFKDQVLAACGHCKGVDERIFQIPAKLHLTLTTLVLLNKNEIKAAQGILEDCLENIVAPLLKGKPLMIDLVGLEYMNDDPGKVDILYGKVISVDGSNILQQLADQVRNRFSSSDLCQDRHQDRPVKLHATLLNSNFRDDAVKGQKQEYRNRKGRGPKESFNASEILEIFGDFAFGKHHIDSLYVAERGRYGEDGFYWPAGKVQLP